MSEFEKDLDISDINDDSIITPRSFKKRGRKQADDDDGEVDPHEQTLGEYEVGHSTVTYIIDKQLRKRVAYSGIFWDADEFLQDVFTLADE